MAFGRSESETGLEESGRSGGGGGGGSGIGGNRPDCAYFLLLGLCGAAFLLTIGGILTYIAFNPGSIDSRPHSALSHIPHFHHHRKHHDRTEGHYMGHFEQHNYHHDELKQHQQIHHQSHSSQHSTAAPTAGKTTTGTMLPIAGTIPLASDETARTKGNETETVILNGENRTTPGSHLGKAHHDENKYGESFSTTTSSPFSISHNNSITNSAATTGTTTISGGVAGNKSTHHQQTAEHLEVSHHNYNKTNSSHHHHPLLDSSTTGISHKKQQHVPQQMHPHPSGGMSAGTHHDGNNHSYEYHAKQSLALAIIGPLCLLMGIIVTLIVGVFALKYDCDHEPEPNIAFLRLRSEMSLNFDPSKNNYELLMPASSSTAGVGSTHSIHPAGMPRC